MKRAFHNIRPELEPIGHEYGDDKVYVLWEVPHLFFIYFRWRDEYFMDYLFNLSLPVLAQASYTTQAMVMVYVAGRSGW